MATVTNENDPTTGGSHVSAPTVARQRASETTDGVVIPMPPQDGFTAEDLDHIPDLPPHTGLIDGNLVLVSPQKLFRMLVLELLGDALKAHAPEDLRWERRRALRVREGPGLSLR